MPLTRVLDAARVSLPQQKELCPRGTGVLTGHVFDELCDGGVVCERAPGCLHVGQLGHELLDLPHCLGIVPLLRGRGSSQAGQPLLGPSSL